MLIALQPPDGSSGLAQRQAGRENIQHEGQRGTLPVARGQDTAGRDHLGRVPGEVSLRIKAGRHGHLRPLQARHFQRPVRELRHRHIHQDVAAPAGKSQRQRVIAQARVPGAPCGHIGHGIAETNGRHAAGAGLQRVGGGAHPVVGVAQGNQADAVLARQIHRAVHAQGGIDDARPLPSVIVFDRAKTADLFRPRVDQDDALIDVADEPREAVDAV